MTKLSTLLGDESADAIASAFGDKTPEVTRAIEALPELQAKLKAAHDEWTTYWWGPWDPTMAGSQPTIVGSGRSDAAEEELEQRLKLIIEKDLAAPLAQPGEEDLLIAALDD